MDEQKAKAFQLLKEAQKRAKGAGGFLSFLGGGTNYRDEAVDLYVRAANAFKVVKMWMEAGQAFVDAAQLSEQRQDARHDAASQFSEAAKCFRKVDVQASVDCLGKSAVLYIDMGRFTMAAKIYQEIAELYETGLSDLQQSIYHYEKAADYYKCEESKSCANKCLLKIALYAAQAEQYRKAIDIYEQIGKESMDNSLLKYSAKDYFFKSLLCYLCMDLLDAQHALQKYDDLYPSFTDSRERKFIQNCILAIEHENADEFTMVVKEYDKISRLDQWTTTLLLRIKKQCPQQQGQDASVDHESDLL